MKKSKKEKKELKKQMKLQTEQMKIQNKLMKIRGKEERLRMKQTKGVPGKDKNLVRLATGKLPLKNTSNDQFSNDFNELNKKEKKDRKKFKKIRSLVEKTFPNLEINGRTDMINAIANSVRLNKAFIVKEEKGLKKWQTSYYNELFADFKKLVDKHNEIYRQKVDDISGLDAKIKSGERELRMVESKIALLKKESALLEK